MDKRNDLPPGEANLGQIREGAGLDDSRINQDFVDTLKKFSTPLLLILVIAAGAYFGLNYYRESQARALDTAFLELDEAQRAGSPDGLVAVANAHSGIRAVSSLARLAAADIHLASARTRVAVAAPLNPDGTPQSETDILTDEQRADQLAQAATLYQRVVDDSTASDATATAVNAMFGLAAVAETRGEIEAAATWYTRIIERANASALTEIERVATARKASLDTLKDVPTLYTLAQLPAAPTPPPTPAAGGPVMMGADGKPVPLERVEFPAGPVMPGAGIPGSAPAVPVMPQQTSNDGIPLAPGTASKPEPQPTEPAAPPAAPPTAPPTAPPGG